MYNHNKDFYIYTNNSVEVHSLNSEQQNKRRITENKINIILLRSCHNQSLDLSHDDSGTVLEAAPEHLIMCLVSCWIPGTEQLWMRACGNHARKLSRNTACTIRSPMDTSKRQSQDQAEHIKNTLTFSCVVSLAVEDYSE